MKVFVNISILLLSYLGYGQIMVDIEFAKLSEAFANKQNYLIEQQMNYYRNYTSDSVFQQGAAISFRSGNKLYNTDVTTETIATENWILNIDHSLKMVTYKTPSEVDKSNLFAYQYDRMKLAANTIEELNQGLKENEKGYRLFYTVSLDQKYQTIDLIFDKKSYEVTKMVMYFITPMQHDENSEEKELPRLEVLYKENKDALKEIKEEDLFNKNNYIIKKEGQLTLVNQCKDYQFINYDDLLPN